jgi:hypothetical protein
MSKYKGKTAQEWAELAESVQRENLSLIKLLDNPPDAEIALSIMRELAQHDTLRRIADVRLREWKIDMAPDYDGILDQDRYARPRVELIMYATLK